jgi:hypothetical protein
MVQADAARASCSKRRRRSSSVENDAGSTLIATSREPRIARPVHLPHSAGAERLYDHVWAKSHSDVSHRVRASGSIVDGLFRTQRTCQTYLDHRTTMGTFLQDLRFALRTLRRTPAFPGGDRRLRSASAPRPRFSARSMPRSCSRCRIPTPMTLFAANGADRRSRHDRNLSPVEIIRLNDPICRSFAPGSDRERRDAPAQRCTPQKRGVRRDEGSSSCSACR